MDKIFTLMAFFIAALASSSQAAIISVNTAFGADTGTQDTVSNRIWLDLSLTRPLSFNGVLAELSANPIYSGFQVATGADVGTFIFNSGLLSSSLTNAYGDFQQSLTFLDGAVQDISGDGCRLAVHGLVSDSGSGPTVREAAGYLNHRDPPVDGIGCGPNSENIMSNTSGFTWDVNAPIQDSVVDVDGRGLILSGVWLFREGSIDVASPGTLALFAFGFVLVSGYHRRRKSSQYS